MFDEDDERNADVELLAECGQIAHRLRSLEKTWFLDLKDLQRKTLLSSARPPLASSLSAEQKLNEIFDNNDDQRALTEAEDNKKDEDPTLVKRVRYLEETVIKIHRQDELVKQTGGQKRATNNRKGDIKSNMNYSVTAKKDDKIDPTTFPNDELKDDQEKSHPFRCSNNQAQSKQIVRDLY